MCFKVLAVLSSLLLAPGNLEDLEGGRMETEVEQNMEDTHKAKLHAGPKARGSTAAARTSASGLLDGHDVVARINTRFSNGRPSKTLGEAGVVVHAFDGGSRGGSDGWFAHTFHWSASVINARVPYMYLGNPENSLHDLHAGIIISSEFAADNLLCTYDHDGVTNALQPCGAQAMGDCIYGPCDEQPAECVPGCIGLRFDAPMADQTMRQWCGTKTTERMKIPADDHCAWAPNALDAMMTQQETFVRAGSWDNSCTVGPHGCMPYNEVILDPERLQHQLPKAVEAIYFVAGSAALTPQHEKKGEAQAKAAQHLFWQMYERRVPLLRFTSFSTQTPFEFVREASD
mmetsp:Transcript_22592/g.40940  ORF Transcript_22592/g.40940 Transcript_22592/m.40940 type:complete len:344 (+) Transcript_22592:75-1106(+)